MADVNPGEGHMVVPHTILATNQNFKIFKINIGVLISYECYKKLPQTQWFKAAHIYYLEVRSLRWVLWAKIKALASLVPSGGFRGESGPCLP